MLAVNTLTHINIKHAHFTVVLKHVLIIPKTELCLSIVTYSDCRFSTSGTIRILREPRDEPTLT